MITPTLTQSKFFTNLKGELKMINFTHENTRFTVTESNAPGYRRALEKPKKHKFVGLSPVRYSYPEFVAGMSTGDYVRAFNRQFEKMRVKLDHDCPNYDKPAPMLDATQPEVLEEIDLTAPPVATKTRKATPAQIRAAALELIETLEGLAIHPSHYAKLKGLLCSLP
jgi:hypothetical protein